MKLNYIGMGKVPELLSIEYICITREFLFKTQKEVVHILPASL